ncbi:MAG: hypothetical protein PHH49_02850 [Candidatus Omnitrophica bacterium]|nr:hypothetical protein [Candidatus Omnitrophota bacterium]MDD5487888.1 hypothetical protein [Candidatus Omnitrophota bacterium]
MKKMPGYIVTICIIGSLFSAVISRADGDIDMCRDPRLSDAYESYQKGLRDSERGDRAYHGRAGKAQRMYEHAEDYFRTAEFKYKELGMQYDIDVSKEIDTCQKRYRDTHVKTGEARKRTHHR